MKTKPDKTQIYRGASERVNATGTKEFGLNWAAANEKAVYMAINLGVDYTDPQIKALLQATCLQVLYLARRIYKPTSPPSQPSSEGSMRGGEGVAGEGKDQNA